MDIIRAYEGSELKTFERVAKANINQGRYGHGTVYIGFTEKTAWEKRIQFTVPKTYVDKGALGKSVIIRVEKDANHGQIINIYFEIPQ